MKGESRARNREIEAAKSGSWTQKTSPWHAVILFNVNFRCAHIALGKLLVSFSSFTLIYMYICLYTIHIYPSWLLLFRISLFLPQLLITSTELNIAANQKQLQFQSLLWHIFFDFEFSFLFFLVFPSLFFSLCLTYLYTFSLPFVWSRSRDPVGKSLCAIDEFVNLWQMQ